MGKLGAAVSRLAASPARLARSQTYDQQREAEQPWRRWYRTPEWKALRQRVLLRDLYTCRQTGVLLTGRHPAPNSPVVDHIQPHRGDPVLFWDESNLQAVSKAWHDSEKQRIEAATR